MRTNLAPPRGGGRRGARLSGRAPQGRWRTLGLVAARRAERPDAPCAFDGPIVGASLTAHVEQVLAPTLSPGDGVVLDTLGSHKGRPARAAIRKAGAHRLSLPPCSPDPNPIKQVLAKTKHRPRQAAERPAKAVTTRIGPILERLPPQERASHLKTAGHAST